MDGVEISPRDTVIEGRDEKKISEDSLADYALEAQCALQFFETWLREVTATLVARSAHRSRPAIIPPSAARPQGAATQPQGLIPPTGMSMVAQQQAYSAPAHNVQAQSSQPFQQQPLTGVNPTSQSAANMTNNIPLEESKNTSQ